MAAHQPTPRSELIQQLAIAPEVDVIGIVAPPGGSATYGPDPTDAYFSFKLHTWRIAGSGIRSEKVRVQQDIVREAEKKLSKLLCPYAVVKLRLKLAEESCFPGLQALMIGPPRHCTDDIELFQIAARLTVPLKAATERFGMFTLNRNVSWYKSNDLCSWNGQPASLTLDCDDKDQLSGLSLGAAIRLWDDEVKWDAAVRASMVAELLTVKNESWLEEGQAELSEADFLSAVRLTSVSVDAYGGFDFWYDDGDLFYGHSINVTGSLSQGITEVAFHG